jgi:1,4-dihydroxy-2-naphthoate octaprenyltransferase
MLDALAVLFSLLIGWLFTAAVFFYGLASKAYSHNKIRVKKMPVLSLIGVGFIQGAFTFLLSFWGIQDISITEILNTQILFAAVISSLFLTAAYPMTQVYQHKADGERGDISFSMLLGIKGTFLFCAVFIALAIVCFVLYFLSYYGLLIAAFFILFIAPVAAFFAYWMVITFRDKSKANYDNTMRLNFISSTALNTFMILLMAANHFKLD